MASVGSILRREREKRRIPLSEIAAATKIPERYLRAIERDDYSVFPAETYLVGFIRNYARELDLDPNEVISIYKNSRLDRDRIRNEAASFVVREVAPPRRAEPRRVPERAEVPPAPSVSAASEASSGRRGRGKPRSPAEEPRPVPAPSPSPAAVGGRSGGVGASLARLVKHPVAALSAAGAVVLVVMVVLSFLLFRSCGRRRQERESLSRVQVIQFEQDKGVFDLNLNEYYRLRLGRDLVPVMGEVLSSSPDASQSVRLLFHIGRTQYELTPGLKKDLDLDLDGTLDLALQLNAIAESSYNLTIFKLRPFTTNVEAAAASTNAPRPGGRGTPQAASSQNEAFTSVGTKKKIVFRAEAVQKVYVKAWVDTAEQEAKVYYPGQSFELVAQDAIQLRIGNPAGLKVTVNGVPVKLASPGQGTANKTIKWKRDLFDENLYTLVISDWQ